jgi:hypothetical protein
MIVLSLMQTVDPQSVFERYGLTGLAVVVLAGAVVVLFRQQVASYAREHERTQEAHGREVTALKEAHDRERAALQQACERERTRADRFENEVGRLNELMQEKVVPVLSEATRSIGDALNFRRRADK